MRAYPEWLTRIALPLAVLLGIASLLIWLLGSHLGLVVKGVVGVLVLVGLIAMIRRSGEGDGTHDGS